jgi:hypothetical protein
MPLPEPHGIVRRTLQRLKRGLVSIDARLDLHGLTQDEAHRHLDASSPPPAPRCALHFLVITGMGDRHTGGTAAPHDPPLAREPANAARVSSPTARPRKRTRTGGCA